MDQNYSIDEILTAVNEIQNKKKEIKSKVSIAPVVKKDSSEIPKYTLKLIEEAEETK